MRGLIRAVCLSLPLTFLACGGGDHGNHQGEPTDGNNSAEGSMADGSFDATIDGHGGTDASGDHSNQSTPPDGSVQLADGAWQLPDGAIWNANGGDDGGPTPPDGSVELPDGAWQLPDGAIWNPNGTLDGGTAPTPPDGSVELPDGAWELPDGAIWNPNGEMDGGTGPTPPDGSVELPDGAWILPDGGLWEPDSSGPVIPDGGFLLPDGGVYDPSHPTCDDPDGGTACQATEICGNGLDDNCNHLVDENCACLPGQNERCYDGCSLQAGIGVCTYGTMACPTGSEIGNYDGHCIGAGHEEAVVCGGFRDYLCDGMTDEGCSCSAGEMRPCYDGPAQTRDVGACQDGVQMCINEDGGTGWGACTGEVLPSAPQCDGIDHACDGMPYEGCACAPGTTQSCYDGPPGSDNVGVCHSGMQACVVNNGMAMWGPCQGEVTPTADMCDGIDRLCNGMPNPGCACVAGATQACYTGPNSTRHVGECRDGVETCVSAGGSTNWGPCTGEVLPSPDMCDGLDHLCNGMPNTGCLCAPGATQSCYDGPPGTAGVGLCHAGTQTCASGPGGIGANWGPCTGEILPAADQCDGVDRACNNMPNAGCTCTAGSTRSCYDGPPGTAGVGQCRAGTQTCNPSGTGWSPCVGETLPGPEVCDGVDHLCNNMPNSGCACAPNSMEACYDGPAGTAGVGLCHPGTQTCVAGPGGVGSSWGPCTGEVTPTADDCDGMDRMCNAMPYAGCACMPGNTRMCYTGPPGTAGVGLCLAGTQSCINSGGGPMWGPCVGEVLPTPELCDNMDHLCNNMPDSGCACTPGTTQQCYSGPPGTQGVGACVAGLQTCVAGTGGVGSSWGPCVGEVDPGPVMCLGTDTACDGNYPADCPCEIGQAPRQCYTGPAGTAGVGTCHAGTETCEPATSGTGTMWGPCTGEVLPAAPQCDGSDHACAGVLPNCNPMVMCPAPVTTNTGVAVSLQGMATAVLPATISGYTWSVSDSPAGSTYSFSSTTANPTMFSSNNAGVYTVEFTATDSMGRHASCSVLVTVTGSSYLGTEFWAVTTSNSELVAGTTFDFAVAIGNPNSSTVTAVISGGALAAPVTFTIPANSTGTQFLPWVAPLAQNSGVMTNLPANCCDYQCCQGHGTCAINITTPTSALVPDGAYHIRTSAPVSAYQFNAYEYSSTRMCASGTNSYTNDASLLLPTNALTGNYIALTHAAWATQSDFVAITGTYPTPTQVTVTMPSSTGTAPDVSTITAAASNGLTLPRGTINVASTAGFPLSGTVYVLTSTGTQVVAYTGVTNTTFTGCTGGAGTMATNNIVTEHPRTTVTAASNGAVLPQGTINVQSTAGFTVPGSIFVTSSTGVQQLICTGSTATTFTGCSGGGGTIATGAVIMTFPVVAASSTTTYTLNQGDVIQLLSQVPNGAGLAFDTQDVTGAVITATQPVSVIGGVDCSFISNGGTCYACDHLEQQIFPQQTWGKDVVVSQLVDRTAPNSTTGLWAQEPYYVRIMSGAAGNTLTFTPTSVQATTTLNQGQIVEFCATSDFEVKSTQPILVEQYMVGQRVTGCNTCDTAGTMTTASLGDPASVLEVPAPQYRTNYNFVVPPSYVNSFINVVTPTGESVVLDPTNVAACTGGTTLTGGTVIAGTTWTVYRYPNAAPGITSGSHTICTAAAAGFGLKVLGVAPFTSYAYPGGLNLGALP